MGRSGGELSCGQLPGGGKAPGTAGRGWVRPLLLRNTVEPSDSSLRKALGRLAMMACASVQRFPVAGLPKSVCFSGAKEPM